MDFSIFFQARNKDINVSGIGRIPFSVYHLGDLFLPTGNLVACDPLTDIAESPLRLSIQPGHYPVSVSVARAKYSGEIYEAIAYSKVKIKDEQPIRWEKILRTSEEYQLNDSEPCCSVDAGLFGYTDELTADIMYDEIFEKDEGDQCIDQMIIQYENFYQKNIHNAEWRCANVFLDVPPKSNVIAFCPGWGNGCYVSYAGYDVTDNLVSVVTDFMIFSRFENWGEMDSD